jgi:transposase-like protein
MGKRRSREEWATVVAELAESGESVESFCRRQGVGRSTLTWWKWRLGASAGRPVTGGAIRLLPVAVSSGESGATRASRGIAIEVGEARVHIEVGADVEYVGALVERLRRGC